MRVRIAIASSVKVCAALAASEASYKRESTVITFGAEQLFGAILSSIEAKLAFSHSVCQPPVYR